MARIKLKRDERPSLVVFVPDGEGAVAPHVSPQVVPHVVRDARAEAHRMTETFKDELLGVLSHELRTPLHVITGIYDLLADGAGGTLTPDQRTYMDTLGGEIDRLVGLIGDVLDASAITAGDVSLWMESVPLPFVIEDVLTLMRPRALGKGVRLESRVAPGLPAVRGDEGRIAQVLTRLLGNAIAFSPAGATVTVRASHAAGQVRVEIEDGGTGIAEEDQQRLFQRFRQVDMSTTREHGGLGMGLFLCKRLIEAQGGRVGLRSSQGAGSTFWFTLDVAD